MRKRLSIMLSLSVFAFAVSAHGPTREKVSESIEINAPVEKVWALVGDYSHPENWMPAIESTTSQGNEKGALRDLHLKSGGMIKEELKNLDGEKHVIQYKIVDPTEPGVMPVNNYSAKITVEPAPNGAKVEWDAAFYRWFLNNNPPDGQNEAAAKGAIEKIAKESLLHLKTVAEGQK